MVAPSLPWVPILGAPLLGDPFVTTTLPVFAPQKVTFATDIANLFDPLTGGADFSLDVTGQQLASDQDLITSITISLFANRLALPTDELPNPFSDDREGWWADPYLIADPTVGQRIGSRLWLLSRSKSTQALLLTAKGYVVEALQWLTVMKVASSFTVDTFFIAGDESKLGITIVVNRRGATPLNLNFAYAWTQLNQ